MHKEIEFGLGVLVTVTDALVSQDGAYAKVRVSVLPQKYSGSVLRILRKNVYRIQEILNKERKIKPSPRIEFILDRGTQNFENVEGIIKSI